MQRASHGWSPYFFCVEGDEVSAVERGGGPPGPRRSNFCFDSVASGKLNGDTRTGVPSKSLRLPTTTMSSSPRKPEVISIQRPSLMPVCTGTDVALPCSTMKTDLPFCVLITAWGGTTNACGISRNPSDTWAKVPGLTRGQRWGDQFQSAGCGLRIKRKRRAGDGAGKRSRGQFRDLDRGSGLPEQSRGCRLAARWHRRGRCRGP